MNVALAAPVVAVRRRWESFWLRPASPLPFVALRIGLGSLLLGQALLLAPHFLDLFGRYGLLQRTLQVRGTDLPTLSGIANALIGWGVPEPVTLLTAGGLYVLALVALIAGRPARLAAILVWALHTLIFSRHFSKYGVDNFSGIFLFYLALAPTGREISSEARVLLRVLQIHLCLAYFAAGAEKAFGSQWWDGDAIWRSVMLPQYAQVDADWLSRFPWLARLAGWGTLLVECGYCVFIWPRATRYWWLAAVVGLHLGIFFLMGLKLFACVMIVLSVSLFGLARD